MLFATTLALAAMPLIKLNNGVEMPAVAAGTWQYTTDYAEQSAAAALSVGIRHIDTASDYCADGMCGDCSTHGGSNQPGIAKAIATAKIDRSELFITTKVKGCGKQGLSFEDCASESVKLAQANNDALGVDHVDLLLVHFPPDTSGCGGKCTGQVCDKMREQWKALSQQFYAANKTRALGVSNFCVSCLDCLAQDPAGALVPAVNQFKYHIGMGADPSKLVSRCKSAGIVPQAYSPLGDNTTELINGKLVSAIGAAHGKSGVQAALRWIWQNGVAVTTKSGNPEHLRQDADLFDWQLTDDEMKQANAATEPSGTPSFACSA